MIYTNVEVAFCMEAWVYSLCHSPVRVLNPDWEGRLIKKYYFSIGFKFKVFTFDKKVKITFR